MGDHQACIKLLRFNEFHDVAAGIRIHTAGLEGKVFAIHQLQRDGLRLRIKRHHHHDRVRPCSLPGKFKRIFRACNLKHAVCPAAFGQRAHGTKHIIPLRVERYIAKSLRLCKRKALIAHIHRNNLRRAVQPCAHHRAKAGRPRTEHERRGRGRDLTDLRRPVPRCEHIAHKERILIRNAFWDARKALVCRRHAHILRLPAIDAAAELPTAFHAVVHIAALAEKAFSAEAFHIHGHAVTGPEPPHSAARFYHFAHEFVPKHHAFLCARHRSVNDVQVA